MSDMPGGSSHLDGTVPYDAAMYANYGGYQSVAPTDADIDMTDGKNVWASEGREVLAQPSSGFHKKLAVITPARAELDDSHSQENERALLSRQFEEAKGDLVKRFHEEVAQRVRDETAAHDAEHQKKLEELAESNRRAQEKAKADYETKMAAFHAHNISQKSRAQHQNDGMEDVRFPDAPAACIPQFIPPATREERQIGAVIRQGDGRLPLISMAKPPQPGPSAGPAPATPEQNTAHGTIDLEDPQVVQLLKGLVGDLMAAAGTQKSSPRKRRKAKIGAQAVLSGARKDQQQTLKVEDDLKYKQLAREVWRLSTNFTRARDFEDYEGVSADMVRRCEDGEIEPDASSYQLYFETGWTTAQWNRIILDKCVKALLAMQAKDPLRYNLPNVSYDYLFALFFNCLKEARSEWAHRQPRLGESNEDARERADAYDVDPRGRNVGTSRKRTKYTMRVQTTDRMMKVCLAKNDQRGADTWRYLRDDVLRELESGGMSSEEDEPVEANLGGTTVMTMAHSIKICPWRLPKITKYVDIIDQTATQIKLKQATQKRFRMRSEKRSTTNPPLGLPLAFYDAAWLSEQKALFPDIEEELEISKKEFTLMEIEISVQMSTSASHFTPDILPQQPLYGHYSRDHQLYTVHHGSADIVRHTPSPEEAPPLHIVLARKENRQLRSRTKTPRFRQLHYIALNYVYLLFIPKRYAWNSELFTNLDVPRHKLMILRDLHGLYSLDEDIARNWLELENCLRALGTEMLRVAPNELSRFVSGWFFPARFQFLKKFRTENEARFAAWLSIENFLPLLGYVSMAFFVMWWWEDEQVSRGADRLNWRDKVLANTEITRSFLDSVEKTIITNGDEEHVGGLYRIQALENFTPDEREQRQTIEWLLSAILHTIFPIPIYLSWGNLPKEIPPADVPKTFKGVVPEAALKHLYSPRRELKFSRWAVEWETGSWYQDPYTAPTRIDAAPSSPALPADSEPLTWDNSPAPAPFPSLPAHSKQKENETIQAFFIRRRAANTKRMEKETLTDRQRRTQRTDHAKKACVFYWEEQDGYYIRQPGGRANYTELWREYPGPQRRYDSMSNEWDLCELFENNDPVFGPGYDHDDEDEDDYDDDDYTQHPIFPQNIDMASRLPRGGDNMEVVQHPDDMDVVQPQPPHDLEMEDVPDLGPDFVESELPKPNLAEASKRCVQLVFCKFGLTPRTEKPEYESCARNLLSILEKRFGFLLPPSPETFIARDPPQTYLGSEHLANVIGMADIGGELASQKGLANILCMFFGQCMGARNVNAIDKLLLDVHHPNLQSQFFEFGREHLRSMRNPGQDDPYFVLRPIGGGIGSEVLLIPRATNLLEVLCQQWGPTIQDVVRHFLARGTRFWLAYVSAEIMPASRVPLSRRPKGFKADTSSGLGIRPNNYEFGEDEYNAYTTLCDLRFLHTPRARIALQYGGVIAWLGRSQVSDDDFFTGFGEDIYDVGDCLWDGTSGFAYWHDKLSDHEIDLLCGVYHVDTTARLAGKGKGKGKQAGQGDPERTDPKQTSTVSWWTKPHAWARGSLDGAWWTPQCDDWFQRRLDQFERGVYKPTRQSQWRHNLKFRKEVKQCWDGYERVAESIVLSMTDGSQS
ncbi:hypothetical protein DFH07DRAFT_955790 [Mycena maculata]|uniref:Uncharacterized protein n=1 Tax=Mycena maculata TaxID=230809 RepID=A0AAD7JHK4_9AGAR|nr:hypothetical protein DFH07DRAFT_955790 [Mycena maculata]